MARELMGAHRRRPAPHNNDSNWSIAANEPITQIQQCTLQPQFAADLLYGLR
jgi:hypothetical protein